MATLRLPPSTRPQAHDLTLGLSPHEERFTERVKAAPGGPRRLAQAVERAALCEADVARRQAGVISFLRQY